MAHGYVDERAMTQDPRSARFAQAEACGSDVPPPVRESLLAPAPGSDSVEDGFPPSLPVIDDAWILRQRGPRNRVDPHRPYAQFVEPERTAEGTIEDVATIFLTNKECPYRCLMCDLWKNTTEQRTPEGAVVEQIEWALERLPPAQHIKLYNSGNFFDGRAIPPTDLRRIAELVAGFKTVIIECHPRLIGPACIDFAESLRSPAGTPNDPEQLRDHPEPQVSACARDYPKPLPHGRGTDRWHRPVHGESDERAESRSRNPGSSNQHRDNNGTDSSVHQYRDREDAASQESRNGVSPSSALDEGGQSLVARRTSARPTVEVAMGLETVDPNVLPRLNKRMTLRHYERATKFLIDHGIAVRAFILLRTPFQSEEEGLEWAKRSIDFAFSIGVACCSIVPTRSGNGAMEWLQQRGLFAPPTDVSIEQVIEYGVSLQSGRAMIDLWDIEKFFPCPHCRAARCARLRQINLSQKVLPLIPCDCTQMR